MNNVGRILVKYSADTRAHRTVTLCSDQMIYTTWVSHQQKDLLVFVAEEELVSILITWGLVTLETLSIAAKIKKGTVRKMVVLLAKNPHKYSISLASKGKL